MFGTLPVAYAIPTADKPIILDMAMTEIPFFQIKNSKEKGLPLPQGAAVDRRGLPTGSLVRNMLSTRQTPGWNPPEYGGLVCAIDITGFTDPDRFKKEVAEMCGEIRRQIPAEGRGEVSIPGDRGHDKATDARKAGEIQLKYPVVEELKKLAS